MNGVLKVIDTLGSYIVQLEQENVGLRQQIEQLKQQLQAATRAEA